MLNVFLEIHLLVCMKTYAFVQRVKRLVQNSARYLFVFILNSLRKVVVAEEIKISNFGYFSSSPDDDEYSLDSSSTIVY